MTYFIFKPDTIVGNNDILYAKRHPNSSSYSQIREIWRSNNQINQPFPKIKLVVDEHDVMLDNYNTGTKFELFSEKLIILLKSKNVKFESFPVELIGKESSTTLNEKYSLFRLLELYPAFDMPNTIIGEWGLKKATLSNEFIESGILMARVTQHRSTTLIHKSLRTFLEANNITGCRYEPLDKTGNYTFAERMYGKNP